MTTSYQLIHAVAGNTQNLRINVAAGKSVVLRPVRAPWSLSIAPGGGGTVAVDVTMTPAHESIDDAVWHTLQSSVAEAGLITVRWPVAGVRLTAMTAAAVVEMVA